MKTMEKKQALYNMELDQHYYHFVVLSNARKFSLTDYWKHLGKAKPTGNPKISYPNFEIEHRVLKRNIPYAGGEILKRISADKKGKKPYSYDTFALTVKTKKSEYVVLAFPFTALARQSVETQIAELRAKKGVDFQKADITSLIKQGHTGMGGGAFRAGIVGLQVICREDTHLSSVTLGGDNPLKSTLYKKFLMKPTEEGNKFSLDYCVLACELQWTDDIYGKGVGRTRTLRSRVRMDIFGNFKFYVHKGGENIIIIPYLLQTLDIMKCLDKVSIDPLLRLPKKEEL
jgi:hypothetical protein